MLITEVNNLGIIHSTLLLMILEMSTPFSEYSKSHDTTIPEPRASKVVLLRHGIILSIILTISAAISTFFIYNSHNLRETNASLGSFYTNFTSPTFPCVMQDGRATSHAGFIGLEGDTSEMPKRSFFW